jgi:hypothetical protein
MKMSRGSDRLNRRRLLGSAATGVAASALLSKRAAGQATPAPPQGSDLVGAPVWYFAVRALEDPYPGQIQAPKDPPPGTRYVAAEVEVINDSDQSLNFTPLDIRLRDEAGTEYRGGSAIGSEPTINPRNLIPGERSRGWVWFIVPTDARPVEVVYIGPPPQFRVPLPL